MSDYKIISSTLWTSLQEIDLLLLWNSLIKLTMTALYRWHDSDPNTYKKASAKPFSKHLINLNTIFLKML